MKTIIFFCLLIGCSYLAAGGVIDTVKGAVVLLPYLDDATEGFNLLTEAKKKMSKAMSSTSNCGKSGSTEPLQRLIEGNQRLGKTLAALGKNLANDTSDSGQLRLLTGDLEAVCDQIEANAKALTALSEDEKYFAENIDSASFEDVDQLLSALNDVWEGSMQFDQAYTNISFLPSRLLLQLVSAPVVSNFANSVHNLAGGYKDQYDAFAKADTKCGMETGMPQMMKKLEDITSQVYSHIKLLGGTS